MSYFAEAMSRLKHELRVSQDCEVAAALGLSKRALSDRKSRDSFPAIELVEFARQHPDLGFDLNYVFLGVASARGATFSDSPPGGMHPADIKASLEKAGSSQSEVASWVTGRSGQKVSAGAVHLVIAGKSKSAAIAKRIAQVVGMPVGRLWPGAYPQIEAEEGRRHG